jgi:PAS domain S-box-containing protein
VTLILPPDRQGEEAQIDQRLREGLAMQRMETIRVAKDGRQIHVSVTASPLKNAEGEVVGAAKIIQDISEVVAAREALAQEKELLATTLTCIGDAVIITDAAGRVTFLNTQAEQMTGWKTSEAQGQMLPVVFKIVNEITRRPVENPVEKVLRVGVVVGLANHTILLAKDGTETPIDDSAAPIRPVNGPIFGAVLVFRDVTAQREAQRVLTRSKEELEVLVKERTARLQEMIDELQHMSYAITHDMRAPLRAMNGFAGLLAEQAANGVTPAQAQDYIQRILVAASRLDKLIQDALHYTKAVQQAMPLEAVDLSKLLPGLIETYPNLQPDQAEIRLENKLPVVMGNESLLTQCFSNLLGNAVKFVPPGVRPRINVRVESNNGMARISIKDNGIGIAKHAQTRLFGMFQKLDNQYEGTGIGLAIVRKVTERMGGKVGVESEAGQGSRFWVDLPIAPSNGPTSEAIAKT